MAMEVCGGCGTRLAIGLLRCPRCGRVAPSYASRVHAVVSPELPERVSARTMPVLDGDPTFKQLRAIAKARGLSGAGTAAELAARISAHDAAEGGAP